MRRLLIKLVAVETALVGWLAYWLFLVYANNPGITQGLASQLTRFPQISFTTVDISVLVIIAVLSIILAFKFQRGLRPGIRLERALQMLENLMKRNLVLEAQVAELKLEKAHVSTLGPPAAPSAINEPRAGSWERAFRTPIEAGPPIPAPAIASGSARLALPITSEASVDREGLTPRPSLSRAEPRPVQPNLVPKPTLSRGDKTQDKDSWPLDERRGKPASQTSGGSTSSTWEDSPKRIGETAGILTPSQPRKIAGVVPEVAFQKQPYIPVPVPSSAPPSVIVGPGFSPPPLARPLTRVSIGQPSPKPSVGTGQASLPGGAKPPAPLTPLVSGPVKPPTSEPKPADESKPKETEAEPKPPTKPEPVKKRFPYEEE